MSVLILFCAVVILSCIITNKFSNKLGMPSLVFFMFLGILFGSDGVLKISFEDYDLTSKLCSIGLLFIIFYGGFCTKKPENKILTAQAVLLSSVGTILTAGFCTIFCNFVLQLPFIESFLIGAVISSTDAASVFSILRSKRLNLKYGTAPLLEMESGSNDPFAYILTLLGIAIPTICVCSARWWVLSAILQSSSSLSTAGMCRSQRSLPFWGSLPAIPAVSPAVKWQYITF